MAVMAVTADPMADPVAKAAKAARVARAEIRVVVRVVEREVVERVGMRQAAVEPRVARERLALQRARTRPLQRHRVPVRQPIRAATVAALLRGALSIRAAGGRDLAGMRLLKNQIQNNKVSRS